jgi:nitroimidazol reductase NimA-like FMN-containing flavoprotein (pyridoxamine 5'-phosphate oxidase superfamily)
MAADRPRLRALERSECLDLLRQGSIGRIGLSIGALPVILPVNYAVDDEQIIVRTGSGTKLAAATSHAVVAFEVDDYSPDGRTGWSVLVRGYAAELADAQTVARMQGSGLDSWALDGAADRWVSISTDEITGRRFHH